MTPLQHLFTCFRDAAQSPREKGTYFEELIIQYFKYEASYRELYSGVWTYKEWADLQAKVASEIYQLPFERFKEYGQIRTEAMFFRDQKGDKMTEADWKRVETMLNRSWQSLSYSVH